MKTSKIFQSIFQGEYVEMLISTSNNDENMIQLGGYLLEIDDNYYFLGQNADAITDCIRKDVVKHIVISQPNDPIADVLNRTPIVKKEDSN